MARRIDALILDINLLALFPFRNDSFSLSRVLFHKHILLLLSRSSKAGSRIASNVTAAAVVATVTVTDDDDDDDDGKRQQCFSECIMGSHLL